MKTNCFPKHFLYLLALVLLCMPAYAAAQGDKQAANVYEQNIKLQERINYLEQKQNDLKERLDEKQAEFEKNVNNRFDLEQKQVNRWEFIVTVLIAVFGIVVPLSFTLLGLRWFKKEKEKINQSVKDAEDTCNAIKQHEKIAKQGADKIDETLQRISKEASDMEKEPNPQNIKDAQQIIDNDESTPYQKAWAGALVVYLTAQSKDDYQNALGMYQNLLTDYPKKITFSDLDDVYFKMGYCYGELGNTLFSYDYYNTATLLEPNFAEAWNNKGVTLRKLGNNDEAIACYDRATKIKPDYAEAWSNKGNTLSNLGKYDEAIESYDRAIDIKPDYADAWRNKGIALRKLSKYDEAIECYNKAIDIKPDDTDAWNNKGNALSNLDKYDEAIVCYDRAIDIKPDDADVWFNKGVALDDLGKYDEAIECYNKAIGIKPGYADAWSNKGIVLRKLSKYDEAIACYDRAIDIKPDFAEAWNNKGAVLENKGKDFYPEAEECYKKALELNPDFEKAKKNLAELLEKMKNDTQE